jgi:hypothetical protein
MTDEPKRWLEDGASGFERELLSSADVDRAPPRALSRTLASVQMAAAATLVASTAVGTSASVGTLGVLKWVGIGVVSGLATMVAVETVTPAPPKKRALDETSLAIVEAPAPVLPQAPAKTLPQKAARDPRSPRNLAPVERETAPEVPSATPAARARDLARETALVSEASRRVEAGDPARALALLDQRAREYPNGLLGPEAAVVRVRALVATGHRKEAEQLAAANTGSAPGSAHARAMQRALSDTKNLQK